MNLRRRSALVASVALMTLVCSTADAQDLVVAGPTEPSIDVQNFQAVPSPHAVFAVESAESSTHLQFSGGFIFNYANKPLVLVSDADGTEQALIKDQVSGDVLAALGLFDIAEVGLALPVYLLNGVEGGTISPDAASGATLGDLRMRAKLTLLNPQKSAIGLAPYVQVGFPTGDTKAFTSSGGFYGRPGLLMDMRIERFLMSLNLSANLQGERKFANLNVGSQLLFGLGAEYEIVPSAFLVSAEVFGSSAFDEFLSNNDELPLEGLVGIKYRTPIGINLELAGGGGIVAGFGSPAYRVIGGLRYAIYDNDLDDDGILNAADACADEPEDRDQFQDEDGCPDPDNDGDGILDVNDNCPGEPEDVDDFDDEDGCPDPDNDGDKVADADDQCPNESGTVELAGCPNLDRDGDGFPNDADPCPDQAEDLDAFQDDDGCPEPDNDLDTVLDAVDKCPADKEDLDGFQDDDGCPEPDNDQDGILDVDDKCPLRKGVKAWNGCPGKKKVVLDGDEIKILDAVFFDTGKATIKKKSFELLTEVADTIKSNPALQKIEVQGHTDDVGNAGANLRLSQARAESVRKFLVEAGVDAGRLEARGFGDTQPAVPITGLKGGAVRKAREANRRVQFKILEQQRKTKVIEVAPDSE